ncbi:hypothetical protein A2691_01315 [Candidatus Woesebacteria bacterium RIFCSPHIGHO2_01_FULL_39_23]|nr:MAG: hypothetical protein A2691_01315 [Candidatus Woesebacteria bacterium RIFCSPHIGHO2_01_FULL_39_23]
MAEANEQSKPLEESVAGIIGLDLNSQPRRQELEEFCELVRQRRTPEGGYQFQIIRPIPGTRDPIRLRLLPTTDNDPTGEPGRYKEVFVVRVISGREVTNDAEIGELQRVARELEPILGVPCRVDESKFQIRSKPSRFRIFRR